MLITAATISLAVTLTLIFSSKRLRRAAASGSVWGLFFTYWIVSPTFLLRHQLSIDGLGPFLVIVTVFASIGLAFGAALTMVSLLPWALNGVLKQRSPDRFDLWVPGVVLPLSWIALSCLIEYAKFGRLVSVTRTDGQFQVGCALLISFILFVIGRARAGQRLVLLAATREVAAAAVLIGVAILPLRDGPGAPPNVTGEPLVKRGEPSRPLVIVALDGVGWNVAEPLISKGQLPWLQDVVARGQRGRVVGRWPPHWSGPAWASIATGFGREHTGVYEDLFANAPGLPGFELPLQLDLRLNPVFVLELELLKRGVIRALPMPRSHLRRPPLWERVAAAGGRAAVFRYPFTYPAVDQSMTVVSNVVSIDLWDFAVAGGLDSTVLVSPTQKSAEVLALFATPATATREALRQILPDPKWTDTPNDVNRIWVLERIVDINEKTFDAAERLLSGSDPFDVVVLHISGSDSVSHAFWKYRFPEFFADRPPHAQNVATLGPIIDRFLQRVDWRIRNILKLVPDANVMVVADHGQSASPWHEVWSGWHSEEGIFAAAGPDITSGTIGQDIEYIDIVPIALALMGYKQPGDLPARSIPLSFIRTQQ